MAQVTIGNVEERSSECAHLGHDLETLVHPALDIAPLPGEETGHPIPAPTTSGQLMAEVEVSTPDFVGEMLRRADGGRKLQPQGVGDTLVGVEGENPLIA